MTLLTEEVIQ